MAETLDKPGRFVSEIPGYSGHFSLPHPFLSSHMQVWWSEAVEKPKDAELTMKEWAYQESQWLAVVALIREFGEWHIENIARGDLETDSMPMAVKVWAIEEALEYIAPFLTPRMKLVASGIL